MKNLSYDGYRLSPEIIHQTFGLYLRFTLSLRDVEDLFADLLAERGFTVSCQTIRRWVNHFGLIILRSVRAKGPEVMSSKRSAGRRWDRGCARRPDGDPASARTP
jgi:putative transposase